MTGKNDDAASIRDDLFLGGLVPQVAERLADRHAVKFDAEAGLARFQTWLASHAGEPVTPPEAKVYAKHRAGVSPHLGMRKMAVYLGLVEDDRRYQVEYESYGAYEDYDDPDLPEGPDEAGPPDVQDDHGGYQSPDWRPEHVAQTTDLSRITTVHPHTYSEARIIGEHFREGTPVIMNLTEMPDSDAKRLVDFAAGLIFGLRGSIERVANKVFLLSPANVEVTAEDKARIAEHS
jgi:cell division inhibitor SepF